VTQLSESQTRSVAAIGNSCVIPAKAGIQVAVVIKNGLPLPRDRRVAVIPAKAGIQVVQIWTPAGAGATNGGRE
jgi:hypothetical protein